MRQQSPYIYKRPKYFLPWNLLIEYNLGKLVLYAMAWEMLCYCYKSGVYPYPYLFFTSLFTLQLFILHWSVVYYPCCDSFRDTAKSFSYIHVSFFKFLSHDCCVILNKILCCAVDPFWLSILNMSGLVFFFFVFLSSLLIIWPKWSTNINP